MIGSLRGEVLERGLDGVVLLEVGGVGYHVTVSPRTLSELEPTTTAFLYVHHHIREDAQTLYGFAAREERTTFNVLIATHGVGPSVAMAILATHTPAALVDIVASADVAALTLVPGSAARPLSGCSSSSRTACPCRCSIRSAEVAAAARPSATSARRSPGSATGRRRSATCCASCPRPTRADAPTILRDALKSLGARRA